MPLPQLKTPVRALRKRKNKPNLLTLCTRANLTPDYVALYEYSHFNDKTGEVDRRWHPVVDLKNGLVDYRFLLDSRLASIHSISKARIVVSWFTAKTFNFLCKSTGKRTTLADSPQKKRPQTPMTSRQKKLPRNTRTRTTPSNAERIDLTPDNVAVYRVISSQSDKEYFACVDLHNGGVECTCPDFNCRRMPQARIERKRPDIGAPRFQCKHIQAAVRDCIERGEIILQLKGTTA